MDFLRIGSYLLRQKFRIADTQNDKHILHNETQMHGPHSALQSKNLEMHRWSVQTAEKMYGNGMNAAIR